MRRPIPDPLTTWRIENVGIVTEMEAENGKLRARDGVSRFAYNCMAVSLDAILVVV